ncbi:MAG: multi-sensor signal transduction histidine kinase [Solirubrobacterales bacterium]|nr:multi-sensor signal transduction histidine kinase [Solirubrobacterales bacterium]
MASGTRTGATQPLLAGDEAVRFLAEASASAGATLDYERVLADATCAAVPRFADWCAIDLVNQDGTVRQIVSGDLDPEHEALLAELRDADCAGVVRPGPRVHIVVPLTAREHAMGAITFLSTTSGRHYGESDVELAADLARRLALAVDNARLYMEAERASERVAVLAEASASVGATLDYERVLGDAARAAVPRFADWCAVDVVEPDGTFRQITSLLSDPEEHELLMELRRRYRSELGASAGVTRAVATGEPELRTDVRGASDLALRPEEGETYERLAPQSYMIVPLVARDRTLGAMTFLSTTPGRHYGPSDLDLATELARRLALAVDNARLYDEAGRVRDRLSFLLKASELLGETLDLDAMLGRLGELTVPTLADACRIYLLEPDGRLRAVSITHADRAKAALAAEIQRRYPVEPADEVGAARVVRTRQPQLIPDIPDDVLVAVAHNEEHLRMLRDIGMRSSLSVPVMGRDGPLGAITLIAAESGRRFGEDEVHLGVELARRAGAAIENARLHAAVSHRAASSEETLGVLIDGVHDSAIFMLDPDGIIVSWNEGAERITGYRAEEIIGRHFSRFYTREDAERGHPADELEIAAAEGRYEEEGWRLRKDGSRFWASVAVTRLLSPDGELRGFAKVTRDMTARKRFEVELRRSNEELERYAYVASHDLSEPLRAIAGFSDLLRRRFADQLGTEGDSFLDAITDGVGRMQALIDDLLAFSRLDSSGRTAQPVAIAEVVDEAIRSLDSIVARSGGRVNVPGPLPVVSGQHSQLAQLFQNLIGNALKFVADGPPIVVVSAERGADRWLFSVRDNGIGVDPDDRERIFDVFERLHRRDEFGGTGVGLAICRKVVEIHGGEIWVEPAPEGGSVFRFTLPPG